VVGVFCVCSLPEKRGSGGMTGGVSGLERSIASGLVAVGMGWGELTDVGDIGGWH
jgi:hypothetical protein